MEVVDFQIVNDENVVLSTKRISEELCLSGHINVFLASFTTCWAWLQLNELLDRLQTRVLYWDTDSVIFTSIEEKWNPPLGELTDELDGDDWNTEFVCNGPTITFIRHTKVNGCVKRRADPLSSSKRSFCEVHRKVLDHV